MAATSVLKLIVDEKEYSASLKNAKQGMQALQDSLRNAGKTFLDVDQKVVDYARALGQMETVSKSAKGKIGEMSSAFIELSTQYKHLTDQEKDSPLGKAMADSLDTLKTRVIDAKKELKDFEDQLKDVSEVKIESKSGGLFGENGLTGMLAVTGGNLLASGIQKLGSEMADTIQQSIELARQGEGIRMAFERLNQPGLLKNLKEATHGTVSEIELMKQAIKFDNFKLPLEDLGTYLAFAQQKAKDTGESIDYLVNSIVTGLGRQSKQILDNLGISASELTRRMNEGADMTKAVADIIREEMAKAGDYVETAADRAARAAADATNKMELLGREAQPFAEEWAKVWNEFKIGGMQVLTTILTPIADSIRSIRELLSEEYTLKIKAEYDNPLGSNIDDNGNYIKKPANGNWAGFDADNGTWKPGYYGAVYNSATGQTEFPDITITGNKRNKKSKGIGGNTKTEPTYDVGSLAEAQADVQRLTKLWNEAGADVRNQYLQPLIEAEQKVKDMQNAMNLQKEQAQGKLLGGEIQTTGLGTMTGGLPDISTGIDQDKLPKILSPLQQLNAELARLKELLELAPNTEAYQEGLQKIADKEKEIENFKGIENLSKDANVVKGSFKDAASAVSGLGSALAGLDDPGAKIAGTIAQAIANIALAFSSADLKDGETGNIWYWIAATAAGMSAMISTISAIHSATGYQNGGVVKGYANGGIASGIGGGMIEGTTYSSDQIPIMANAGEVILNRAQSSNIASQLQKNGGGAIRVVGVLKGEDIVLMADRYGLRTGRGELAFWNN